MKQGTSRHNIPSGHDDSGRRQKDIMAELLRLPPAASRLPPAAFRLPPAD